MCHGMVMCLKSRIDLRRAAHLSAPTSSPPSPSLLSSLSPLSAGGWWRKDAL
jgi:hypothetical protein